MILHLTTQISNELFMFVLANWLTDVQHPQGRTEHGGKRTLSPPYLISAALCCARFILRRTYCGHHRCTWGWAAPLRSDRLCSRFTIQGNKKAADFSKLTAKTEAAAYLSLMEAYTPIPRKKMGLAGLHQILPFASKHSARVRWLISWGTTRE